MNKIIFLLIWLLSQAANGLQIKYLQGNKKLTAEISAKSINRISIEEDRIAQIFGLHEDLVVETDDNTGQIFIRVNQENPIDLTLITEKQVTLDLHLLPKNIPGETIIIKTNKSIEPNKIKDKTSNYVEQITSLMLAMAGNKNISGYLLNKVNKEILLWDHINLLQTKEYVGNKLIGEIYLLTNKTKERIFLTETQFGWRQGIAAVSVKKKALVPNEQTEIYIIRHIT